MRSVATCALFASGALVALGALSACAPPVVDGAEFAGDETACNATLTCQGAPCGGVEYKINCAFNDANDIYDCTCSADGVDGETFSEAGVCEQENGEFTDFDLADASAHGADDCKFPIAASAEE